MAAEDKKRQLYESWVADYATPLYRLAYRLSGEAAIAEDLVQETFYHAWRSMHTLREESKARPWLNQMLRYRYAHWLRDKSRRIRTTAMADGFDNMHPTDGLSPLTSMADQEFLQKALDDLDDRYKIPLLMVYLDGRTCQETADELELPLGTILSRMHRARGILRERMTKLDSHDSIHTSRDEEADQSPQLKLGG